MTKLEIYKHHFLNFHYVQGAANQKEAIKVLKLSFRSLPKSDKVIARTMVKDWNYELLFPEDAGGEK